jgi:hypothetical protein
MEQDKLRSRFSNALSQSVTTYRHLFVATTVVSGPLSDPVSAVRGRSHSPMFDTWVTQFIDFDTLAGKLKVGGDQRET